MNRRHPEAEFVHGLRFVDNDSIITTAGVSAGIDGALHLVARLLGLQVAANTARYMEYAWTPEPHFVETYPVLNPTLSDAGRAAQIAAMQMQSGDAAGAIETYERGLEDESANPDLWYGLFRAYSAVERWKEATEASLKVAASNPIRGYYNAACSAARNGDTELSLSYLEKAIDAGFRNRSWLERDGDLDSIRKEPGYERLLERMN
jgi:tetratricopeptide (TPR) repeat protein